MHFLKINIISNGINLKKIDKVKKEITEWQTLENNVEFFTFFFFFLTYYRFIL